MGPMLAASRACRKAISAAGDVLLDLLASAGNLAR
jgi:hypothetical protein